jgi:GDP-L-fucose synthase
MIPAIIRRFVEAKRREDTKIVAWETGNVSREFLYIEDAAEGILLAAEHYEKPELVNLGSGTEITIWDLALLISELTGFRGEIEWDRSQPNRQPRRYL